MTLYKYKFGKSKMTRYGKTMMEALSEVREGYSPKQIKMAIGIASDKRYAGGNMSGAVTAIEKIKKGLSDHKQVAAVLKRQNEDVECGCDCGESPCVSCNEEHCQESIEEAKSSTGYDLYHKTFSGAMQHSYAFAKKKFGMEIDPEEIDDKVATGPAKPKTGKTNTYRLKAKGSKKGIQVQVYNTGKSYELNMYKEEVELDENKNLIKDYEKYMSQSGKKSHNAFDYLMSMPKYKRMSKDQMAKIIGDHKRKGIFKNEYQVEEEVELDEGMKMNDPKLLKVFDKLKKGSTVKIKHDSTLEKGKDFIEYIVKSKNMVNKGRVEKITMARKDSPTSAKRYLYKRDEKVTMAMGDMAVSPVDIKEDFEPHMMYDPKTGKGYKANTMDDHLKMKKMGYTHDKPEEEVSENKKADLAKKLAKAAASSKKGKEKVTLSKFPWKKEEAEEPNKPDSAKEVEKGRDDKKKTRIAQLQLQIAKAQETINKMNAQEK